jgi:hypothetical protein
MVLISERNEVSGACARRALRRVEPENIVDRINTKIFLSPKCNRALQKFQSLTWECLDMVTIRPWMYEMEICFNQLFKHNKKKIF